MATPDELWWEAQAGEYVLGTLRGIERDVFEKILSFDVDVRQLVEQWQKRLSDLDLLTPAVQAPNHVLPDILAKIHEGKSSNSVSMRQSSSASINRSSSVPITQSSSFPIRQSSSFPIRQCDSVEPARPAEPDELVVHQAREPATPRSNSLWKSIAMLATAATLAMAVFLLQSLHREVTPLNPEIRMVSVLQNEQREALWVLTSQDATNTLRVVALAPPLIEADRSFQLWMVKPDNAGVNSVGLLPETEGETMELTLPVRTDQAQRFAVSLEPKGGSTAALPIGPVLSSGNIITLSSRVN